MVTGNFFCSAHLPTAYETRNLGVHVIVSILELVRIFGRSDINLFKHALHTVLETNFLWLARRLIDKSFECWVHKALTLLQAERTLLIQRSDADLKRVLRFLKVFLNSFNDFLGLLLLLPDNFINRGAVVYYFMEHGILRYAGSSSYAFFLI